jgi:hypothetical protein
MISVITPTVRKEGLALIEKALKRQTFQDFEWIITSPFDPTYEYKKCDAWVVSFEKEPEDYWTVYKDYNRAIAASKGELIVSWQDFTYTKPDTLERFWFHHMNEPKTIVGAVGNKYSDDSWTVLNWKDPREREDQGAFYQCYYNDIELNLSAFPREAFYAVGGFDEYLDKYSSLCGLDVLDRLNMLGGYDFKLDQTIKSYSLEHPRLPGWEENLPFAKAYPERRLTYLANPKLSYLK